MDKYEFKKITKESSVALSIEFAKHSLQLFEYDRTDLSLDRNQQKLKYFINNFESAYSEIHGLDMNDDF